MKAIFNTIYIFSLLTVSSLMLISCDKDEDQAVLKEATPSAFAASETSVMLTEGNAGNEAITFNWTPADFGYQAAVSYSLQFDKAGNDFSDPQSVTIGVGLEKLFTVAELNDVATQLALAPEVEEDIEVRVSAVVSDLVDPAYSNVITIAVTAYSDFIEPTYIYVPGAYQGWDPGSAASLISVEDNGIYVGYLSFTDPANLKFKFTPERKWDLAYGDGGEGVLSSAGPDLSVPEVGTYWIEVDLNELTWSATPGGWGLIGDATPGGWDTDTDMVYDYAEDIWELDVTLSTGNIKFRLNDSWDVNYGDDDTSNTLLNAGGADIPIAVAGNYTIILDLSDEGSPTYTLTKN